jgi:predicted phosphodiesterase
VTTARVAEATDVLARFASYREALAELSSRWGKRVTNDALYSMFRRDGAGKPSEYLGTSIDVEDVSAPVEHGDLSRILIIPDVHCPFEDKRAFELMLKAGQHFKPDIIVTLGDFIDCYSVSAHSKDPRRVSQLETELSAARARREQLDQLGAKVKHAVLGNHEHRLERYLCEHAPALFSTVDIADLLGYAASGWQVTPYRQHVKIGKVFVTHDVGQAGQYAAFRAGAAFEGSVIIGHTHRMTSGHFGNAQNERHVAMSMGWLGDAEHADYMHRIQAVRDWQLGFGIAHMERDGTVHPRQCPIVNYRVTVDGRLICG